MHLTIYCIEGRVKHTHPGLCWILRFIVDLSAFYISWTTEVRSLGAAGSTPHSRLSLGLGSCPRDYMCSVILTYNLSNANRLFRNINNLPRICISNTFWYQGIRDLCSGITSRGVLTHREILSWNQLPCSIAQEAFGCSLLMEVRSLTLSYSSWNMLNLPSAIESSIGHKLQDKKEKLVTMPQEQNKQKKHDHSELKR